MQRHAMRKDAFGGTGERRDGRDEGKPARAQEESQRTCHFFLSTHDPGNLTADMGS